jgi:23S rRNA (adenine2503-C2)-methyltransferase
MTSLYDLPFDALRSVVTDAGLASLHGRSLWRALHREADRSLSEREDLSPPLRRWLKEVLDVTWTADLPEIATEIASSDGLTRKLLLRLHDGKQIETVIMGYPGRFTACISTQVGCAMGCVFCATGQGGFTRHLTPGEIVSQVVVARLTLQRLGLGGLRNLVLMGMGEPLHNYDAVMTALDIISDTRGLNIGPSKISISTVGVAPNIRRLADEQRPYSLALSLHAANDERRSSLIPVNARWPLAELLDACRYYGSQTGRRIFIEWTLIAGENDSPQDGDELIQLLTGMDVHINLIPLNPTSGFAGGTTAAGAVNAFQAQMRAAGFPATVRQRRGIDVAAGCGQLAGATKRHVA